MLDRALLQLQLSDDIGVTTPGTFGIQTCSDSADSAGNGSFVKEMAPETQATTLPTVADLEAAKIQENMDSPPFSKKRISVVSSMRLKSFVQGPLDVAMAVLVCIHLFFMVALIELEEGDSRFS